MSPTSFLSIFPSVSRIWPLERDMNLPDWSIMICLRWKFKFVWIADGSNFLLGAESECRHSIQWLFLVSLDLFWSANHDHKIHRTIAVRILLAENWSKMDRSGWCDAYLRRICKVGRMKTSKGSTHASSESFHAALRPVKDLPGRMSGMNSARAQERKSARAQKQFAHLWPYDLMIWWSDDLMIWWPIGILQPDWCCSSLLRRPGNEA
jgi:hypothetical protein